MPKTFEEDIKHYFSDNDPDEPSSWYFVMLPESSEETGEDENGKGKIGISIFSRHQYDRDGQVFSPPYGSPLEIVIPDVYFDPRHDTLYSWDETLMSIEQVRGSLLKVGCVEIAYDADKSYVG